LEVLEEDVGFECVEEFFFVRDEGGEERCERGCTVLTEKSADGSELDGRTGM
jgi:hypothetical protein